MTDLISYYSRRAQEYERVYEKLERQGDLARLAESVASTVAGRSVLEVACGTGYWTELYASSAHSVLATDASPKVLALAGRKSYPPGRVRFALADACALHASDAVASGAPFAAAVVAFWWSHVPAEQIPSFLRSLHACLSPGAAVWVCDNRYVEGSSTPISHADDAGDTYQRRRLADGSEHVVLKNFPSASDLRSAVAGAVAEVEVEELDYYWILRYVLGKET